MEKKVIAVGDIHGEFGVLNEFINKKHPDIILCCGDFGFWPREKYNLHNKEYIWHNKAIKTQGTKIYWAPGNHEDWDELERLYGRYGKKPIEITENVFYCPLGSYLEEEQIFFLGGAFSVDWTQRIEGHSWFRHEMLTNSDLMNIYKMWDDKLPEVKTI